MDKYTVFLALLIMVCMTATYLVGYYQSKKDSYDKGYMEGKRFGYTQAEKVNDVISQTTEDALNKKITKLLVENGRLIWFIEHTWDYELMARLLSCESGDYDTQVKIANTIFNRVDDPEFPNTIMDVMTAHNQFTPISNGSAYETEAEEKNYFAVLEALVMPKKPIRSRAIFFNNPDISANQEWFDTLIEVDRGANTVFYRKRGSNEVSVQESSEALPD